MSRDKGHRRTVNMSATPLPTDRHPGQNDGRIDASVIEHKSTHRVQLSRARRYDCGVNCPA